MATTNPRITVTLTRRQHEVLRSISDNSGKPMSGFIHEVLEESLPVLERMAETFRKIKEVQDEQRRRISHDLDQAQQQIEPVIAGVLGQFDMFMTRVEQAVGASPNGAPRRAVGKPSKPALTPVTNRGVTPTLSHPSKPLRRKASGGKSGISVFQKKGGSVGGSKRPSGGGKK
jgi:predicted DNA-binding protein